jgi:hypothetical protein
MATEWTMAIKILVDEAGGDELEQVVRSVLGRRPEAEEWVVSLVKNQPLWSVNVLVSPGDRLWGWTYLGLRREVPVVLAEALRVAGFRDGEPWALSPPLARRHPAA